MTDLHKYEEWLDLIQSKMSILNGTVTANFKNEYSIPLVNCDTPKKALNQALAFSAKILSNEQGLPWDTLGTHLLRLASKKNNLSIDAESLYHGYKIRFAGEFEPPKISNGNSSVTMEFKGKKPNYLNLTLNSSNTSQNNVLQIKRMHCFTSDMYEFVEVKLVGIALTNRHIILCLPEKSKWNRFKGSDIDNSIWHEQDWTRLAIGFTDINNLITAYSELRALLGNEFTNTPLWAEYL